MATLPVFRTWVAGEIVTAAYMNSNVRDSGNFFLSWPVCELRQTTLQSVANNGGVILFGTEDVDTDNGHSTVTNTSRYTPQTTGRFQYSGGVSWSANATGRKGCWWVLNASSQAGTAAVGPSTAALTMSSPARTMTFFANGSTDFVELLGYQESGGALNTNVTGVDQSSMSVRMVGTV